MSEHRCRRGRALVRWGDRELCATLVNADTFFSRPARIRDGEDRVYGFVTFRIDTDAEVNPVIDFVPSEDQEEGRRAFRRRRKE